MAGAARNQLITNDPALVYQSIMKTVIVCVMSSSASKLIALPLAAAVLAVSACSPAPSGRSSGGGSQPAAVAGATEIAVVASTNVWGDIAATVGGDKVAVTSLITNPDADPHEYEASTRNQLSIAKAQVVIENGGGYDDFVSRMVKSAGNDKATVLNAVTISGKKPAAGQNLNEHVWYDFPTVVKVIDRIEDAYASADPADEQVFSRRADALKHKIDKLEQREADLKQQYAGDPVSITEPVPLYLLDAVGLTNKTPPAFSAAIEEDSDVSPRLLETTLQLYSKHQVDLLAYNEQTSGPETEKVLAAAKQNHIPVVPVTETLPAGKDYLTWMSGNLDAVGAALKQAAGTTGRGN